MIPNADKSAKLSLMAHDWLQQLEANSSAFFELLLPQIDDSMLQQIAEADYGNDAEKHLAPLKQWRDHRTIPILNWHPAEVLELIRWSEPENPDWKPGATGHRGHLLRAFSCATLLRSYAHPENKDNWLSLNETTIQLSDSIKALGKNYGSSAMSFFVWCFQTLTPPPYEDPEAVFFSIAILRLVANDKSLPDEAIINLCQWIEACVALQLEARPEAATDEGWLLSLNYHDLRNKSWMRLGQELQGWAINQAASERATSIAVIGQALLSGQE